MKGGNQMELLNEAAVSTEINDEEVGGDVACLLGCGSLCLIGIGTGTLAMSVMAVATIL